MSSEKIEPSADQRRHPAQTTVFSKLMKLLIKSTIHHKRADTIRHLTILLFIIINTLILVANSIASAFRPMVTSHSVFEFGYFVLFVIYFSLYLRGPDSNFGLSSNRNVLLPGQSSHDKHLLNIEGSQMVAEPPLPNLVKSFFVGIGSILEIFPDPQRFDAWRLIEEDFFSDREFDFKSNIDDLDDNPGKEMMFP